jgi:hypothetical protein
MANTALSSGLAAFCWEAEDSFGDSADDTYTIRHQLRDDQLDVTGLQRPMVPRGGVQQRLNEGQADIPGPFGVGTFTVTLDASGMGTTTVGDLTEPNLSKLLAHVFGNVDWTDFGGQDDGTGAGVTNLEPDGGSEAFSVGGMVRVGALGDGRGGGQAYVIGTKSGTPVDAATVLNGLAVKPNDNDVIYAMGHVYPVSGGTQVLTSDGSATNNTIRCVLMTNNLQWVCRGCACTGVVLSGLEPGGMPQWQLTFSTVAWGPVNQTFPSATATADYAPAPSTNGTLHWQAKGTTTRNVLSVRDFTLNIGQGMQTRMGQGGENTAQNVVGWVRTPAPTTVSITVEAEAATATPTWWDLFATSPDSITLREGVFTANTVDGRALALYLPNCKPIGSLPTQSVVDGLNMVTMEYECLTNTVTTSELTLSNWRLSMG